MTGNGGKSVGDRVTADGTAKQRVVAARASSGGGTSEQIGSGAEPAKAARKASGGGKNAAAKKSPAKKTAAATSSGKKAAAKAPAKKTAASGSAKKTPAKKSAAKRPAGKAPAKKVSKAAPERLAVRADESPWTEAELAEVRELLEQEATRLREEISDAEDGIAELLRASTDTGGEDQADTGSKTFEREHEMSLAASHREILGQTERALTRIDNGTYGICERCGNPIGKARLQAFPRATLCMSCKEREERR